MPLQSRQLYYVPSPTCRPGAWVSAQQPCSSRGLALWELPCCSHSRGMCWATGLTSSIFEAHARAEAQHPLPQPGRCAFRPSKDACDLTQKACVPGAHTHAQSIQ